ncbi:MAG: T9SS type A sorting domain-containing protein [Cyclobacteriaceae bacterium]
MPKYSVALLLCMGITCSNAQVKHSIAVSVVQGVGCPVVSGLEETEHIQVFPNPVNTSFFTIRTDFKKADAQLFDLGGTSVFSGEIENGELEINVDQISSGVYIINVFQGERIHKMKIRIK